MSGEQWRDDAGDTPQAVEWRLGPTLDGPRLLAFAHELDGWRDEIVREVRSLRLSDEALIRDVRLNTGILRGMAPHIAALAAAQEKDGAEVARVAVEVATIARAVQAIGASFTEFASKSYAEIEGVAHSQSQRTATLAAAVENLTKRLNETRRTVNAVSGPRVPDLADITGVHSVTAIMHASLAGELAKRDAAEAQGKLSKRDAAEAASRAKFWQIISYVITAVIGLGIAAAARHFGIIK